MFSHGQLYVAVSDVTARQGLKLLIKDDHVVATNIPKISCTRTSSTHYSMKDRGMSSQALKVLYQMQHEGISPTAACWDSVISVFMKNEQINEALEIFNEMLLTKTRPNLRTWSLLISGLSRNGMHYEVMNLCCKMQEVEPAPSPTIFSAALVAMKAAASVQYGKAMHACIVKKGLLLSKSVIQSLLNMYGSFSDRGTVESLLSLLAAAQ